MPDSCCKTVVARCGQRAHPSNIYKVEVSAQAPAEACRAHPTPPHMGGSGRGAGRSRTRFLIGRETAQGCQWSPQSSLGTSSCWWEVLRHHGMPLDHPRSLWAVERLEQAH